MAPRSAGSAYAAQPSARRSSPGRPSLPVSLGATALAALALSALVNDRLARRAEQSHAPLGGILVVDNVRLHVLERGTGPVLVMLHGNGSMIEDFISSGLVDDAARSHRVIAIDRPGFGHSERPRATIWTPEAQADLIGATLDRLGVTEATVLGHSWGCSVAVALARRRPDLAKRLVLASGYFYPTARVDVIGASLPAVPILGDVLRVTVAPLLSRAIWPLAMRAIFGPAPVPAKFAGFPREMAVRPSQLRASAAESALMIPSAARAQGYADLTLPLAIVAGAEDRLIDPDHQSARLHDELPRSTFDRVAGAGHMVHQTAPGAILAAVDRVERAARTGSGAAALAA